ncbi:MAG: hypothetical protein FJ102_02400 [Deltaproteobacteria bacterium]|nr:hypothetical protein [Deltaproteobacteria bacterium]
MPLPPDVTTILSAADIERLRGAFANASYPGVDEHTPDGRFGQYAQSVLLARFPLARKYVDSIGDYFYDDNKEVGPQNRERVVIATLLSHANDGGYFLTLHVYWALMIGLSVREIAWTMVLCSSYSGIDRYTLGMTLLTDVTGALKAQLAVGTDEAIHPGAIVGVLAQTFATRH